MILANDNETFSPYQIAEGINGASGEPQWYVRNPQRNTARRISVYFLTREQAERARDVLIADDRRLALRDQRASA